MGSEIIASELERIRAANDGILRPPDVVREAEPVDSPLHESFEWDETKAAHEHRLWQARTLIRVSVRVIESDDKPSRSYVSLPRDRHQGARGYRDIEDVLKTSDLRDELLAAALEDFRMYRRKYQYIKELAGLFAAADEIVEAVG